MSAYLFLLGHIEKRKMHRDLAITALATQGDSAAIKDQLKKWNSEL